MPIIQVQMFAGRSEQQKQQLIAELTACACRLLAVPPEGVRVLLQEFEPQHWGIAGVSVAQRRAREEKK